MRSILLAASILCADTVIKKRREKDKEPRTCLDGHVQIMTYHNYGAFLNSGEKNPFLVKMLTWLVNSCAGWKITKGVQFFPCTLAACML